MRNSMRIALSLATAVAAALLPVVPAGAQADTTAAPPGEPTQGEPSPGEQGPQDASEPSSIQEHPAPLGANDWTCEPTARHPRPVVLVHGFGAPAAGHFSAYAPYLAAQGYCVFTGTYGTVDGVPVVDNFGGFQRIEYSAEQLRRFVVKIRASTGADKVDIVGHSEGGVMPRYYIKYLGGRNVVRNFVSWAPPNHGLTLSGLYTLGQQLIPGLDEHILPNICGVCSQLTNANGFLDRLNSGDETPGDVDYTVLASKNDALVTPYTTSFLRGADVTNITLQDVSPHSPGGHISLAFDPAVWKITGDALRDG